MILKVIILALCATLSAAIINEPNIYRPCQVKDVACVQNSLRSLARCQPPRGSAPPVLRLPQARFDTPAFNASYVENDLVIRGLDRCQISEYYFNRKTGAKVLAIDCPWLTFESKRIMYQHYPRREDGIFRYGISGSYPLTTLTLSFTTPNMNLCQEYPSVHVHALPIFNISPFDRPTSNHLTRDLAALGVFEQEMFASRAQLLTRAVVNNKICNFGC